MTPQELESDRTIRCGVFRTLDAAERAVRGLQDAGFTTEQISVLCSDKAKENHFRAFEHEDPAGSHAMDGAAKGGLAGAGLGALIAVGLTTGVGIPLLVAGGGILLGGAIAGTFVGLMQTRGEEGTLADFYDQALTQGDLLVAVQDTAPGHDNRLLLAENVFRQAGAAPVPLTSEPLTPQNYEHASDEEPAPT